MSSKIRGVPKRFKHTCPSCSWHEVPLVSDYQQPHPSYGPEFYKCLRCGKEGPRWELEVFKKLMTLFEDEDSYAYDGLGPPKHAVAEEALVQFIYDLGYTEVFELYQKARTTFFWYYE